MRLPLHSPPGSECNARLTYFRIARDPPQSLAGSKLRLGSRQVIVMRFGQAKPEANLPKQVPRGGADP